MNLEQQLEALLFWKGEPMTQKKIEGALGCTREALETALTALETNLQSRGLRMMRLGDEIELRTAPEVAPFIEKLTKDELMRDLGKAGLETLAIILYKSPVKRSEIDYIRGVNSSFIIRNLLVRGLIERITETVGSDGSVTSTGRGYAYKPTIDLLAHMGIAKLSDLPEYEKVTKDIEAFSRPEEEAKDTSSQEVLPDTGENS